MSLNVYLKINDIVENNSSGIFIRENGRTVEITEAEWANKNPDKEFVKLHNTYSNCVYESNITHNLTAMASKVRLYHILWRPDEVNVTKAKELINPLRNGLHKLKLNPKKYIKYNPENGWGSYDGLVSFVERYLNACYKYPEATVEVSR